MHTFEKALASKLKTPFSFGSQTMGSKKRSKLSSWIFKLLPNGYALPKEYQAAKALIKAIDKGGIPLNPAKVNSIARDLRLEVSVTDPIEQTIQRIRHALSRVHA